MWQKQNMWQKKSIPNYVVPHLLKKVKSHHALMLMPLRTTLFPKACYLRLFFLRHEFSCRHLSSPFLPLSDHSEGIPIHLTGLQEEPYFASMWRGNDDTQSFQLNFSTTDWSRVNIVPVKENLYEGNRIKIERKSPSGIRKMGYEYQFWKYFLLSLHM